MLWHVGISMAALSRWRILIKLASIIDVLVLVVGIIQIAIIVGRRRVIVDFIGVTFRVIYRVIHG